MFFFSDLLPLVCYTRELHIAWLFSRCRRARGRERDRRRTTSESNEKREMRRMIAGWDGKAREKREVMSSAFAQSLTGLYESVEYIHAARWKPTGNTLGSYVTLLRHLRGTRVIPSSDRTTPRRRVVRVTVFFSTLLNRRGSPGHDIFAIYFSCIQV